MELGPAQAASPTGLQLSNSGYEGHILFLLFPKLHSNGPFNWLLYDLPWVRREHPQPLGFTHSLQVRSHPLPDRETTLLPALLWDFAHLCVHL